MMFASFHCCGSCWQFHTQEMKRCSRCSRACPPNFSTSAGISSGPDALLFLRPHTAMLTSCKDSVRSRSGIIGSWGSWSVKYWGPIHERSQTAVAHAISVANGLRRRTCDRYLRPFMNRAPDHWYSSSIKYCLTSNYKVLAVIFGEHYGQTTVSEQQRLSTEWNGSLKTLNWDSKPAPAGWIDRSSTAISSILLLLHINNT